VATEGRILTEADVTGGNPVRTIVQSTQASDEGAPSLKDAQVLAITDPNTPANLATVTALGSLNVNIAQSGGAMAPVVGTLTTAAAATVAGAASTTATALIDVSAAGNVSFHLAAGATAVTNAAVVFEQSLDPAGTLGTWAPVPCVPEDGVGNPSATWTLSLAVNTAKQFTTAMLGPRLFRVRLATVPSTGTLAYYMTAGPFAIEPQPALAPSGAVIGHVGLVGGPTATLTASTVTTSAAQIYAADPNRRGVIVWNTHASNNVMLGFGATPTASLYSVLIPAQTGWRVDPEFAQLACSAIASGTGTVVNISPVSL
jgi:hypothetical protein